MAIIIRASEPLPQLPPPILAEEDAAAAAAAAKLGVIEDAHIAEERLALRAEEHRDLMRFVCDEGVSADEARSQLRQALEAQRERDEESFQHVHGAAR